MAEPLLLDVPDKTVGLLPDIPDKGEDFTTPELAAVGFQTVPKVQEALADRFEGTLPEDFELVRRDEGIFFLNPETKELEPFTVRQDIPTQELRAAPQVSTKFRILPSGRLQERDPTRREILQEELGFETFEGIEGGSVPERLAAALGDIEDVKRQIGKRFDIPTEDVELLNIKDVGVVFRNPETGKIEPLDIPGLDIGDVAVAGVEAPVIAGEIAGAIGGGIATRGPAGVIGGAAIGAGGVRAAQLTLLEQAGIITPEDNEITKRAATDAALAAAFSALPSVGRGLRGVFSPEQRALNLLGREGVTAEGLAAGRARVAPLEEVTGAEFSAGQRLAQVEPVAGPRLRATELADEVTTGELERGVGQEAAEARFRADLIDGSADPIVVGREITDEARQQYLGRVDEISRSTVEQTRTVNEKVAEFAGISGAEGGASIRSVLQEGRDEVFETLSKQYDEILAQIPEGTSVNVSGLKKVGKRWRARLNEDIFPSLAAEDRAVVKEALKAGNSPSVSFSATSRALSALKEQSRLIGSPLGGAKVREKRLIGELIDELQTARDTALKGLDPEIAAAVRSQDALWRQAKEKIDEGVVGSILQRKKGTFQIADDAVFRKIIRSEADLRDYLRVAEDFPQLNAVDDIKRAFDGLYTEQVVEGNVKHATWLARNRKALEQVYTPEEMVRFRDAGLLQDELILIQSNEKRLVKELQGGGDADGFRNPNTGFIYKLGRFDPEDAVKATKGSPSNARRMMDLLGDTDKAQAFRDVRMQQLMDDTAGSPEALKRALTGDSRRELEIIFGPEHVANLDDLARLAEVRGVPGTVGFTRGVAEKPGIIGTTRKMIFGPLDRQGFRIRVGQRFFPAATDDAMLRILRDPNKLETLLRVNEKRVADREFWNFVIGTLGFTINDIANILENDQLGPEESVATLKKLMKENR